MGPDAVRFTVRDGVLYAACFGWPDSGRFVIKSLGSKHPVSKDGIKSITMLGSKETLRWNQTAGGLEVTFPKEKPCDYAYVLRIVPKGKLAFE